eukprot:7120697-Prymnesium_polylepis.1
MVTHILDAVGWWCRDACKDYMLSCCPSDRGSVQKRRCVDESAPMSAPPIKSARRPRAPANDAVEASAVEAAPIADRRWRDEPPVPDRRWRYRINALTDDTERAEILDGAGQPLTFFTVFRLLKTDTAFATLYNEVLQRSAFDRYYFECPAVSKSTARSLPYQH